MFLIKSLRKIFKSTKKIGISSGKFKVIPEKSNVRLIRHQTFNMSTMDNTASKPLEVSRTQLRRRRTAQELDMRLAKLHKARYSVTPVMTPDKHSSTSAPSTVSADSIEPSPLIKLIPKITYKSFKNSHDTPIRPPHQQNIQRFEFRLSDVPPIDYDETTILDPDLLSTPLPNPMQPIDTHFYETPCF